MVRKVILIFIIGINLLTNSRVFSQNYTSLVDLKYAESLYADGNYDAALKEYLRCNYFKVKSDEINITKRISDLYLLKKDYKKALIYLDRWYFENINNEEIQVEAIISKTRIYTINNDFNTSIIELLQLPEYENTKLNDRIKYYLFINYLLANNLPEASKYGIALSYLSESHEKEITEHLKKYQKIINKNPNHAVLFSSVVPGLGQMLNGDIKDGLISLAVVGGLAFLFIDVTQSLSFQDAALSITPWLIRYYLGGLGNAKKQAKKRIEEKKLNVISDINAIILNAHKSLN